LTGPVKKLALLWRPVGVMKFSSKTIYALRALFDITFHNHGRPTKVEAIAEREQVPPRFLEQIFQDLKSAGLVGSKRGPNGGYFLLRSPESVTLLDVVRAMEGPMEHACCFATDAEVREKCAVSSKCVTAAVWRDVATSMENVLAAVTLSDLSLKGEQLGVKRNSSSDFTYVI
jgi:Rrf2 family protein